MSALSPGWAAAFEALAAGVPPTEAAERRAAFARFAAIGLPGPSDEAWHYTDLADRAASLHRLAGPDDASGERLAPALPGADLLVYTNGRVDPRHGTVAAPAGPAATGYRAANGDGDGIDALNAAFATPGLDLRLAPNSRAERPLQVLLQTEAGDTAMVHQRHRITLGAHAEATVLLHFVGRGGTRLATHRIEVELEAGAVLHLHRLSDDGDGATLVSRLDAKLARDARLHLSGVSLGAGLARHRADVFINGPGAEVHATSLQVPGAQAQVDDLIRVVHAAPHGLSRIVARGIVDARAKAVFNGRVVVQPGAQKTDSEQRLANLLLSRKAEVNAKPDLEIHADDVKCAHGATVGQLDAVALAYLRSRGIPLAEARALLLKAFATETLERLEWPALQAAIGARLGLPPPDIDLDVDVAAADGDAA